MTCPICLKDFAPNRKNNPAVYCGKTCRIEAMRQRFRRLTADAVLDIRASRERGEKVMAIALRHGVTASTVSKVANFYRFKRREA